MAKRSKVDRLFRLWDALIKLRDIAVVNRRNIGKEYLGSDTQIANMGARRAIRRIFEREYNMPTGMINKDNLTVGGCIYLIRKPND